MKFNVIAVTDQPDQIHKNHKMCSRNTKMTAAGLAVAVVCLGIF